MSDEHYGFVGRTTLKLIRRTEATVLFPSSKTVCCRAGVERRSEWKLEG